MFFNNDEKKKQEKIDALLNIKDNEELFGSLTALQNEISVGFNTKIIAVVGIKGEELTAAFSKGFGEAYALNGSKSLVIDANLYNPSLAKLLNNGEDEGDVEVVDNNQQYKITTLNDKLSVLSLSKQIYPSELFKSGIVQTAIKVHKDEYEHFIIIVPEIKNHKEIFLLADIIECIVLLTFKNITRKKDIFDAIQFMTANKLPLAKTVLLK